MRRLLAGIAVAVVALVVVRAGYALDVAGTRPGRPTEHRPADANRAAPIDEQNGAPMQSRTSPRRLSGGGESITGALENISGDTYYAKFRNSSSTTYRVYYTITDGNILVQEETSIVVQGNSTNSKGPYHCSSSASIHITRTDQI